jgi:predicted nucleic acid-binding protein
MLVVKDSMILIHLAKMQILKDSCRQFGEVMIPTKVYEETVVKGKEKGHPDALIIEEAITTDLVKVKEVRNKRKVDDLKIFGLHLGEAEAVVLYFQEQAQFLATDDDTCRRNRIILGINIIGSPAIVLTLLRNGAINRRKALDCVLALETIGWFDIEVINQMNRQIKEVDKCLI